MDAALDEFAEKGFKRASTNAIVKKAGIGKGMLFYYFGSKEELFDFLCEYTIELVLNKYYLDFTADTGDFIERYRLLTERKRRAMNEMPKAIRFFESFYLPENAEYFGKYANRMAAVRGDIMKKLYGGVDGSLFRDGIDPKAAVRYIKWLLEGYEADLTAQAKNGTLDVSDEAVIAAEWERFYAILRDLRKIFYR
mgnify:CR=1 FL=1